MGFDDSGIVPEPKPDEQDTTIDSYIGYLLPTGEEVMSVIYKKDGKMWQLNGIQPLMVFFDHLIAQEANKARLEALGDVVIEYGQRQALIWVDGKTRPLQEVYDELKAQLTEQYIAEGGSHGDSK